MSGTGSYGLLCASCSCSPVVWLVQGDVSISGTVSLPGQGYIMCTCLGLTPGASAAPLLLDENFSYTAATLLTANGWAAPSGAGTNDIPVTAAGLSYSGYPSSGMGHAASMLTSGEDVHRTYTPQTSGSVYYAFMVNVSAAHTTGDYFTHFGTNVRSTTFPGRVSCRSTTGSAGVEDSDEPSTGVGGVGLRQGTATQAPTLWD